MVMLILPFIAVAYAAPINIPTASTIVNAAKEMTDQPVIYFDIDGTHKMSAKFTDPASVKTAKVGDTMTVTCKIGGADDKIMMVTDCVKK